MAKIGVGLKIDVSKIEKERLYKGEKGAYLDATAFIDLDELDQYGQSGMITQDVSKDEKQAGTKGPILGNAKVFWKGESQTSQQNAGASQCEPNPNGGNGLAPKDDFDDDIPFN